MGSDPGEKVRWMSCTELFTEQRWEVLQYRGAGELKAPCRAIPQRWEVSQNISVCWRMIERSDKNKYATAFRLVMTVEQK